MNEYLKAFQSISSAADNLLDNEDVSLEIKKTATNLIESVQPCFIELRQSANKLNSFIEVGSTHLDYADKLWNSKPRIASTPKDEIWQQLGEISGYIFKFRVLANQCKIESIKQAKYYWEQEIDNITNKWFFDSKGQQKKGVGWSEKDNFNQDISASLGDNLGLSKFIISIKNSIKSIYEDVFKSNQISLPQCANNLDDITRIILTDEINSSYKLMRKNFNALNEDDNAIFKDLKTIVELPLKDLVKPRKGDLFWEEVSKFKNDVFTDIENFIDLAFDDAVKVIIQTLEAVIAFANEFLERQERYQQETPEQRAAEKAWIDQQRQQFKQIQMGLQEILQIEETSGKSRSWGNMGSEIVRSLTHFLHSSL